MVSKAITSYVKRPNNHSAFQNSCIMFIGHFFLLCAPSIGKCDFVVAVFFISVGSLHSSKNSFQSQLPLYNYYLFCAVYKKTSKKVYKIVYVE